MKQRLNSKKIIAMKTLNEAAQNFNLEIVNTTSDPEGYNLYDLKKALTGFASFEEAEKVAEEIGGHVEKLVKPFGDEFWTREGHMYQPVSFTAEMFGDNYAIFDNAENYWMDAQEVLAEKLDGADLKEVENTLKDIREAYDAIDDLDEGEVALCENYRGIYLYRQTLSPVEYTFDSKYYTIGVIAD